MAAIPARRNRRIGQAPRIRAPHRPAPARRRICRHPGGRFAAAAEPVAGRSPHEELRPLVQLGPERGPGGLFAGAHVPGVEVACFAGADIPQVGPQGHQQPVNTRLQQHVRSASRRAVRPILLILTVSQAHLDRAAASPIGCSTLGWMRLNRKQSLFFFFLLFFTTNCTSYISWGEGGEGGGSVGGKGRGGVAAVINWQPGKWPFA